MPYSKKMHMIKKFLPICCLIILLAACKDSSKNTDDNIESIDLSKIYRLKQENRFLSEFAKGIEYIKLETKPECLLAYIRLLHIDNKSIIIKDFQTAQVYAFKRDGKFIGKMGEAGRGPGEYTSVSEVIVFPHIEEIHLYCPREKQIIRFDFNYKQVGVIKMELSPCSLTVYQNKYYLCSYNDIELKKNGGNDLIVRDPISFKDRKVLFKRNTDNLNTTQNLIYHPRFLRNKDTLYYAREISNKKYIYRIFQDKVKPVFLLNGEFPREKRCMNMIDDIIFIGDNLFFRIIKDDKSYKVYYNLKTKTFSNCKIVNDIDKGPTMLPLCHFNGGYTTYLRQEILASFLKEMESNHKYKKMKCKFPEKEKWLKESAFESENDNPCLMIVSPAN